MHALIRPSDIPGLFDVFLEDGRVRRDLTVGQTRQVIWDEGLEPFPKGTVVVTDS